jgi:Arm DNA-binding domain
MNCSQAGGTDDQRQPQANTQPAINDLLRKAKQEGSDQTPVVDGKMPGLYFMAGKTRRGSWFLRYSFGGEKKKVTIGQYPDWGISEARDRAKEHRRMVDTGLDPSLVKAQRKA